MSCRLRFAFLAAALGSGALGLGACQSLPASHFAATDVDDRGAVEPVLRQILCEVSAASAQPGTRFSGDYAIAATVTIKSEDTAALAPSLSFIDPFGRPGSSYTTSVGGEIRRGRSRSFTQTFALKVGDIDCPGGQGPLRGGFGLGEVIATGVRPLPAGARMGLEKPNLSFGSTIEFKLTRALNGGPAWVRPLFKGPNSSGGLLQGSWVNTSTLVIAFAPPTAKSTQLEFLGVDPAEAAARQQLQIMILQNLAARTD